MKFARVLHVFACLLLSAYIVFGQAAAPDAEKSAQEIEKKALSLLERTIGDADSLRLPENRVYVFASAGTLLWTRDEKRARQLFRRAATEFAALSGATEDDGDELPENYWMLQNVRNQFLNAVAALDAELALELLRQTRLPVYERMLNLPPEKIKLYRNLHQQAQSELNLEKDFAARLAKQNPRRAVELARAGLSKGASYSDLNLINQLKEAEPELASKFADDVLKKLLDTDISDPNDYTARSILQSFLSQFTQPSDSDDDRQLKLDKNALRKLAAKYADFLAGSTLQYGYGDIQNSLPIFERILPERVAALKQRYERLKQNYDAQNQYNQFQDRFNQLNNNGAAETLVAEAENFPIEMRPQMYSSAAAKMMQAGNYAAGRQLLAALPGKQARQNALFQYDWQSLYNFLNSEKYAEAEQIIAQQIDRSQKIRLLVQTANHFAGKKESEKAAKYLAEARSLVNPNPENYNELSDLMQVLGATAEDDAEKTFDLVESFVPKFNEIFAATAFLSKYQPNSGFREGELVISPNGWGNGIVFFSGIGRSDYGGSVNINSLRLDRLGKANLERATNLADRFERADLRIAARMMILRGALFVEKNADSQFPVME